MTKLSKQRVKTGAAVKRVLKKALEISEGFFDDVGQKIGIDAYANLGRITPEDTAFAKGRYRITFSKAPDGEEKQPKGPKRSYYPPLSEGGKILSFSLGDIMTLYNNTAYVGYLNDGTPKMKAHNMIARTEQMIEVEATNLFRALSKKVL